MPKKAVTLNTTLSGNFRLIIVEERFDKHKHQYFVNEKGVIFVPLDDNFAPVVPALDQRDVDNYRELIEKCW